MKKMKKFIPTLAVGTASVGMIPLALTGCSVVSSKDVNLLNIYRPDFEKYSKEDLTFLKANEIWNSFLRNAVKDGHKDYFAQNFYGAQSKAINDINLENFGHAAMKEGELIDIGEGQAADAVDVIEEVEEQIGIIEINKIPHINDLTSSKVSLNASASPLRGDTITYVSRDIESISNVSISFENVNFYVGGSTPIKQEIPVVSFTWGYDAVYDYTRSQKQDGKLVMISAAEEGYDTNVIGRKGKCVYTNVPLIVTYDRSKVKSEGYVWHITPIFFNGAEKFTVIGECEIEQINQIDWCVDLNETWVEGAYDESSVGFTSWSNVNVVSNATLASQYLNEEWDAFDSLLSAPITGCYYLYRAGYQK